MNTLVSFEIAKLLKEKGFDKPLPSICFIKEEYNYTSTMVYEVLDMNFEYILRPTIAEVVMWLYEKHGIWIEVSLTDNSRHTYFDYTIVTSNDRDYNDEDCFDSAKRIYDKDKHGSPTEAYEAAIEYTLTNLIK